MKVVVLGAGVVGVSTAWSLVREGHEVEVLERCEAPALGTSYANGGQISVGSCMPWGGADVLRGWVSVREMWRGREWLGLFLRRCTRRARVRSFRELLPLSEYSQTVLEAVRSRSACAYEGRQGGILRLFRHRGHRIEYGEERLVTAEACCAIEPTLASGVVAGGVYVPEGESGDARVFTCGLAREAQKQGVVFRFGVQAQGFEVSSQRVICVRDQEGGEYHGDAFVVAAGIWSVSLMRSLDLWLPMYPLKGYSVTLAAHKKDISLSVTDEDRRIVISPLGERVRAAGLAELGGYDLRLKQKPLAFLLKSLGELFPQHRGTTVESTDSWCGLRPMTPDSKPLLGQVGSWSNLYLNTGHGPWGWTLCHGTARAISSVVSGREPEIDITPFRPTRFGRW